MRLHAEFYLREGYIHPDAHLVIRERLLAWVEQVEAGGEELRGTLQAEIVPANPISQGSGKIHFEDRQVSSTFSGSEGREPPRRGRGVVRFLTP
jgi:hypothetical protein